MKSAGLITGISFTIMSFIALVIFLMLPSLTNNRVNLKRSDGRDRSVDTIWPYRAINDCDLRDHSAKG